MRRNDVVMLAEPDMYRFYGRVVKFLDDKTVLWICCGLHLNVSKVSELEVVEYAGKKEIVKVYRRTGGKDGLGYPARDYGAPSLEIERFRRMPSLRKLKQRASRYAGRSVWRK